MGMIAKYHHCSHPICRENQVCDGKIGKILQLMMKIESNDALAFLPLAFQLQWRTKSQEQLEPSQEWSDEDHGSCASQSDF